MSDIFALLCLPSGCLIARNVARMRAPCISGIISQHNGNFCSLQFAVNALWFRSLRYLQMAYHRYEP